MAPFTICRVCRVGESLNQVPFAMDAVVLSHSIPGELAADNTALTENLPYPRPGIYVVLVRAPMSDPLQNLPCDGMPLHGRGSAGDLRGSKE